MDQLWNKLIADLEENPRDFQTHLVQTGRMGKWFYAWAEDDIIFISNAKDHWPSSSISTPRKLTKSTFVRMYDFYKRREKGERVSKEVSSTTFNQVYWYSLIHSCL